MRTLSSRNSRVSALVVIRCACFDRRHEAVAPPTHGFDEAGPFSAVIESATRLGDDRVQAVIEINKDIRGPKLGAQFLASHHLVSMLQQNDERLKGFFLEGDAQSMFAQLPRQSAKPPETKVGLAKTQCNSGIRVRNATKS